jgi:hypothetical protein
MKMELPIIFKPFTTLHLLNLEDSSDKNSLSFLLADHFIKMLFNIQLQDLLKVY